MAHAGHARINGEPYVLLDRSVEEVIHFMAKDLDGRLKLSWPVTKVEYGAGGAVAHGPEGQCIRCQHVLITAPISCLGSEDITFKPPLPTRKRLAMKRVQMCNAVKVLLAFSKPFRRKIGHDGLAESYLRLFFAPR